MSMRCVRVADFDRLLSVYSWSNPNGKESAHQGLPLVDTLTLQPLKGTLLLPQAACYSSCCQLVLSFDSVALFLLLDLLGGPLSQKPGVRIAAHIRAHHGIVRRRGNDHLWAGFVHVCSVECTAV